MRQYFSLLQLTMEIITDSFNRQHYYRNETPSPYDKSTIAFRGQRQMFFFLFFFIIFDSFINSFIYCLIFESFSLLEMEKALHLLLKIFLFFSPKIISYDKSSARKNKNAKLSGLNPS